MCSTSEVEGLTAWMKPGGAAAKFTAGYAEQHAAVDGARSGTRSALESVMRWEEPCIMCGGTNV